MAAMIDGTELYHDALRRIRELETLNSLLAEQVDRMRPVVDAAIRWYDGESNWSTQIAEAVDAYQQQMAQVEKV